ncbi:unnamed protein product, partial [Discosporangium mesarthrocarpum]
EDVVGVDSPGLLTSLGHSGQHVKEKAGRSVIEGLSRRCRDIDRLLERIAEGIRKPMPTGISSGVPPIATFPPGEQHNGSNRSTPSERERSGITGNWGILHSNENNSIQQTSCMSLAKGEENFKGKVLPVCSFCEGS